MDIIKSFFQRRDINNSPEKLSVQARRCIRSVPRGGVGHGVSLVHLVAANARHDLLKLLLKTVPRLDVNDRCNRSVYVERLGGPVENEKDLVLVFIRRPSSSSHGTSKGVTALHLATACRSRECAWLLLNHGADANAQGSFNETALHYACAVGDSSLVKFLLTRGAHANSWTCSHDTPLHVALINGQDQCVKALLHHGADANAASNCEVIRNSKGNLGTCFRPKLGCGDRPLHYAVAYPSIDSVRRLTKYHGNVTLRGARGKTVLCAAVAGGSIDILEHLHASGCSKDLDTLNGEGLRPLDVALKQHQIDIVRWLLEHGVNPNTKRSRHKFMSPIARAVADPHCPIECILLLLKHGAHANQLYHPSRQMTLLHLASCECRPDVVLALVRYGADASAKLVSVGEIMTPVMLVATESSVVSLCDKLATLLVLSCSLGTNLDEVSQTGETALHMLVKQRNCSSCVRLLLDAGADPTALTHSGMSPADVAVDYDVRALIKSSIGTSACCFLVVMVTR